MTTIHAQVVGEQVLLSQQDLEALVNLARQVSPVTVEVQEDDWPTLGLMLLAERGSSFAFWNEPEENVYTRADGEPLR